MTARWLPVLLVLGVLKSTNVDADTPRDGAVLVRGGTFRMGTPASAVPELKRRYAMDYPGIFAEEIPDHQVTVSDFRMDRHEVTNAQFADFVMAQPQWSRSRIPLQQHIGHYLELWHDGTFPANKADHPVVYVTWHAAQSYCRWAGGRLPTEAEWEYADRAGRDQEFPWGDALPSAERANYSVNGIGDTTPVGRYPPNALGLYDMAGNVWEFILDAWNPGYAAEPGTDPVAGGDLPADLLSVQGRRVLRGGSFDGGVVNLRTRWRDSHDVLNAVAFVGFRCAYPTERHQP